MKIRMLKTKVKEVNHNLLLRLLKSQLILLHQCNRYNNRHSHKCKRLSMYKFISKNNQLYHKLHHKLPHKLRQKLHLQQKPQLFNQQ